MRLDYKRNMIRSVRDQDKRENRILKIPKLGTISVDDYDLNEMPSPTMVNVDNVRFDFKNSLRNSNFRSGKQYESIGLRKLCPNLFVTKFRKESVPRQMSYKELENQLPSMTDANYKESLILRAQMRKANVRDMVFMSHMS